MTTPAIDGVDRALPRYRQHAHEAAILRHTPTTIAAPTTQHTAVREVPDKRQVVGIPLFVMRTPAWRRQHWDEPQTSPSTPPC